MLKVCYLRDLIQMKVAKYFDYLLYILRYIFTESIFTDV